MCALARRRLLTLVKRHSAHERQPNKSQRLRRKSCKLIGIGNERAIRYTTLCEIVARSLHMRRRFAMIRPFLPKNGRRFIAEFVVVFMLALIAGTGLAVAQDGAQDGTGTNVIGMGQTVTGTLDAKTFARVYTFTANDGDTVTLTATSKSSGLFLAMLLSGPDGNALT